MPTDRSHKVPFLLGVATGVALTHPELRKNVRPLVRWAVREGVRLKARIEQVVASSAEELEDLVAEAKAEGTVESQAERAAASPRSGAEVVEPKAAPDVRPSRDERAEMAL
ncbi:MAG: DUF5132 domain-containing protein [Myxococcales bacterium]|nr:DUF5132 domain-containing protein [Myxococcales bacterium]MDD9966252.1 DUF5132 domain-containing protein [Myxococcales bacterium]